jgi:hypothetical protein
MNEADQTRSQPDGATEAPPRWRFSDFTFVGSGHSRPSRLDPVSENHDEAFVEDLLEDLAYKRPRLGAK